MDRGRLEEQVAALREGRAFLRHEGMRLTWLGGSEALDWLQDLVTADVGALAPFSSRRSLLLTPTGRIRADFHVLGFGDARRGVVLAQAGDQPQDLAEALRPYVLSSDVDLRAAPFELISIPSRDAPVPTASETWRPSVLGAGLDLLAFRGEVVVEIRRGLLDTGLVQADTEAVEAWRIRMGIPRFPVDLDEESLPAEAGLDDEVVIDRSKGCYLGQESVAKVRNLGHPTRTVLPLRAAERVTAGEAVLATGVAVGLVTSADVAPEGCALLARVRWDAREAELETRSGIALGRR
jgi:folate-binding protein YgfZ